MIDVAEEIRRFNAGRDPERLALKYRHMRDDAFAFLRGTNHLFQARLPGRRALAKAPAAWACGDLHLENFGSYKGDNRQVYFDLNDFDDAALAPASWDVVRLLASLRVGAAGRELGQARTHAVCEAMLAAYGDALAAGCARWIERETANGAIRRLLDGLRGRQRAAWLDARTERKGRRRRIRLDGRKALPASDTQRAHAEALLAGCAKHPAHPRFFEVLDVARRIAGTGSLGVDRYVVLVEGKGSPDGNYLLDLKAAQPSALAPHLDIVQPEWPSEARRVVTLQQRMQALPMAFLQAVGRGRQSYVLRALQPAEDRVALDGGAWKDGALDDFVRTLGRLVAWAQLRSSGRGGAANADALIAYAQRKKRRRDLLEISEECAARVEADWRTYCAAYDDGRFDAPAAESVQTRPR